MKQDGKEQKVDETFSSNLQDFVQGGVQILGVGDQRQCHKGSLVAIGN